MRSIWFSVHMRSPCRPTRRRTNCSLFSATTPELVSTSTATTTCLVMTLNTSRTSTRSTLGTLARSSISFGWIPSGTGWLSRGRVELCESNQLGLGHLEEVAVDYGLMVDLVISAVIYEF